MFQSLLSGSEVKSPGSGWGASLAPIRVPAAPFACESTSRQSHTHISASRSHSLRLLLLGNCSDEDNPEEWDIARAHAQSISHVVCAAYSYKIDKKAALFWVGLQHCSCVAVEILYFFVEGALHNVHHQRGKKRNCVCLFVRIQWFVWLSPRAKTVSTVSGRYSLLQLLAPWCFLKFQ